MSDTLTMSEQEILDAIQSEVAGNKVFLYMKGTPEMPRCGFSNQVVQILNHLGVEYGARDILVDPRIRQVLSGWSDWPTIPQLFVDGKLVGGCDIVTEMFQEGELQPLVGAEAKTAS
jgi:monothiol glutaredoxin